ncbi:hypothetical protein HWB51_gp059 [Mycobacterium phage Cuke]|uniref:Uncharacterized protein n=1 Tax=Mycobacterium phage Cuke TaxID=2079417 RepID=A0A2L1IWW2_9CAUD|nr:hypothetical protein HWB51_gp059 [Mycobacterium phage Cuke]AVD99677.1 hypothetical protein SEA_CUKE_59 [Mycobacterium phage Cuke]
MSVQIRNALLVEAIHDRSGEVVGKAVRGTTESTWYIGRIIKGKMTQVATVEPHLPEVMQRKIILAIMKEIG